MTDLRFTRTVAAALRGAQAVVVVAPKAALDEGWHRRAIALPWAESLDPLAADARPGDLGSVGSTYGGKGAPRRLFLAALPDEIGRHNSKTQAESIRHCVAQVKPGDAKRLAVVVRLADPAHHLAAAVAVARCFPHFDRKSGEKKPKLTVAVVGARDDGSPVRPAPRVEVVAEAVRLAARLVDTPAEDMNTADMEAEARAVAKEIPGAKVTSIVGEKLLDKKLGGIHAVGRAASVPPRLVVLEYRPKRKPRRTVALVGKGLVYDTGGLNIKVGTFMPNMKCDMGGAAAVLGAFAALAKTGCPDRVYALLCLAENAVGPKSYRPDDILDMHSGKTVEVNNTDAEGRLVLADGVSWAARVLKADLIVDAATLTGAALIASGEIVSCTYTNRDGLEALAVRAGRDTGDLTMPILFIPEFHRKEFESKVADMRNSVKNRANAQTSCAGQFIYNHLAELDPPWIHIDLAGPAFRDGRGTGYGVALIAEIVESARSADLADASV